MTMRTNWCRSLRETGAGSVGAVDIEATSGVGTGASQITPKYPSRCFR
jgi:hypothetical protein